MMNETKHLIVWCLKDGVWLLYSGCPLKTDIKVTDIMMVDFFFLISVNFENFTVIGSVNISCDDLLAMSFQQH